jgi:hypothetical protein
MPRLVVKTDLPSSDAIKRQPAGKIEAFQLAVERCGAVFKRCGCHGRISCSVVREYRSRV